MQKSECNQSGAPSTNEDDRRPLSWEVRRVFATAVWELLQRVGKVEFSSTSQENFAKANELLLEHSVIMYINHTSLIPDAAWSIALVLSKLSNLLRVLGPVAMKHADAFNHPVTAMMLQVPRAMGVELFPVVTRSRINPDGKQYSPEEQKRRSDRFQDEMKRVVSEVGTLVGIAPQGTRNPEGSLLKALSGIGRWEQFDPDDNLIYLPVAIITSKHGQPEMVVGEPLSLNKVLALFGMTKEDLPPEPNKRAHLIADLQMERLALLMDEKYRGPYGKKKIKQQIDSPESGMG